MAGPTQFTSNDTRRWWLGYGSGADGDLTISSNTTEAPIDSACTGTATQTSLSATNASFASGQAILIHQTKGTGAGQWELGFITGYTAGTITLKDALYYSYATGAQVRVLKQYKNVTINTGIIYTAKAWNGTVGGILAFLANGTTTVTGTITAIGKGFRVGTQVSGSNQAYQGEGITGVGGQSTAANGIGGGGGLRGSDNDGYPGMGGGGGHATNGSRSSYTAGGSVSGYGGGTIGEAALRIMYFGGGGGGMNSDGTQAVASGGGIVFLISKNLSVTGYIYINGAGDVDKFPGGGAGGSGLFKSQIATLGTNLITASGGVTGWTTGGVGRIHLDYVVSYTGTTTPTINVTQDLTLRQPISRRMIV